MLIKSLKCLDVILFARGRVQVLRLFELFATALQQLRHMIVTGELTPGEQIRQQETADLLGVSRVPLREAMNVLANQGMLLHRPNQGYFVVKRAPGELAQIRRMMHALENELVKTSEWPDRKAVALP